ncbi:MAG: ABC transporter substrate-binding protein [Solirubrobacterales bacterium]
MLLSILRGGRFLSLLAVLAAAFAVAGCGGDDNDDDGTAAADADPVTVQLDFVPRGNHGMFYVAEANGYFADEGIEVEEIRPGTGSPDAMRTVASGQADFGFGDLPTLATAKSQGADVVALVAVNQTSPLGFCSKAERLELSEPADMAGNTMAIHPAGSTFIFYRAFLAANDLERGDFEERTVTPPYENFLLQDQVDIVQCYIDAEVPELEAKAGGEGSLSILLGSDHGYEVLGSGLFTSAELAESDPELVQRFVNAYMRAFEFVREDPEETARIIAEASPELAGKEDVFEEQLVADEEATFTSPHTEEEGLGHMDPTTWQNTVDVLEQQEVIEGQVEVQSLYDNRFVEEASE